MQDRLVLRGVRHQAAMRTALLLSATAAAVGVRVITGGAVAAASIPAALLFATAALSVAFAAGWRPGRPTPGALTVGAGAGGVLVLAWLLAHAPHPTLQGPGVGALAVWTPAVALVVLAEEALLRGAVFDAVSEWNGAAAALAVTSVVFALLHLPLYGVQALPIDLGVGVFLGGLRVMTGGVAAPAVAHLVADLGGAWLA